MEWIKDYIINDLERKIATDSVRQAHSELFPTLNLKGREGKGREGRTGIYELLFF